MRKTTKKLFLLPALIAALALAGCSSSGAAAGTAAPSESRLAKILASKTIKIAVPSEALPWGIKSASGQYEGYDIDLANALGESLGAKVEFVAGGVDTRIPNLQTDKADALMFSFSALNARAQSVEMSTPYAAVGITVAVPVDSPIKSYADLAGKTVSAVRAGTAEAVIKKNFPDTKVVLFQTQADEMQALKSGKVDALFEINTLVDGFVASDPKFKVLDGPAMSPALISVGVKQGDQVWLNYINNFIRNWNASGSNEAASQKWFKSKMTVSAQ
jgi:polar amino acid transport system substrate-binding protein